VVGGRVVVVVVVVVGGRVVVVVDVVVGGRVVVVGASVVVGVPVSPPPPQAEARSATTRRERSICMARP
jgi:hypothetical protein